MKLAIKGNCVNPSSYIKSCVKPLLLIIHFKRVSVIHLVLFLFIFNAVLCFNINIENAIMLEHILFSVSNKDNHLHCHSLLKVYL